MKLTRSQHKAFDDLYALLTNIGSQMVGIGSSILKAASLVLSLKAELQDDKPAVEELEEENE